MTTHATASSFVTRCCVTKGEVHPVSVVPSQLRQELTCWSSASSKVCVTNKNGAVQWWRIHHCIQCRCVESESECVCVCVCAPLDSVCCDEHTPSWIGLSISKPLNCNVQCQLCIHIGGSCLIALWRPRGLVSTTAALFYVMRCFRHACHACLSVHVQGSMAARYTRGQTSAVRAGHT